MRIRKAFEVVWRRQPNRITKRYTACVTSESSRLRRLELARDAMSYASFSIRKHCQLSPTVLCVYQPRLVSIHA